MPKKNKVGATILVVADDEEIRDGIEVLLEADGYQISPVRNEEDAIDTALRDRPDLILVSLDQSPDDVTASARRVRFRSGLRETVPIVMFCMLTVAEGEEISVGENTYATWPANFNQLRNLLGRLLGDFRLRSKITPLPPTE